MDNLLLPDIDDIFLKEHPLHFNCTGKMYDTANDKTGFRVTDVFDKMAGPKDNGRKGIVEKLIVWQLGGEFWNDTD